VRIVRRRRWLMPKCGVCGWSFSDRTLTKHAETACGLDEEKADRVAYSPEIDDLIKIEEEASE
jgi:hypothetical protein